jgi:histidinol-phosphate aminotransferase
MPLRVRSHIGSIAPYSPGKPVEEAERELGKTGFAKLASNENPWGASPNAIRALHEAAQKAHRYPDAASFELRRALSEKYTFPEDLIVVGSGSDEIIHYLSQVLLDQGDEVIVGDPGFPRYESGAILARAVTRRIPLDENEVHDLNRISEAVTSKTRIVWIANPNNPTGTIITKEAFESFLGALPAEILVVLDEAYHEFVAHPGYPNGLDYVRSGKPVACLRTFSKAYGLAGLRVGYGFVTPEIADAINRIREPFNLNIAAQSAAHAALADTRFLEETISRTRKALGRLASIAENAGGKVTPSHANFLWVEFGPAAQSICERLMKSGVIVRSGVPFGRPNCIRITVGTDEELSKLEHALSRITSVAAAL